MSKTLKKFFAPISEVQSLIYSYSFDGNPHKRPLKVGQAFREVKQRIAEQVKTGDN